MTFDTPIATDATIGGLKQKELKLPNLPTVAKAVDEDVHKEAESVLDKYKVKHDSRANIKPNIPLVSPEEAFKTMQQQQKLSFVMPMIGNLFFKLQD